MVETNALTLINGQKTPNWHTSCKQKHWYYTTYLGWCIVSIYTSQLPFGCRHGQVLILNFSLFNSPAIIWECESNKHTKKVRTHTYILYYLFSISSSSHIMFYIRYLSSLEAVITFQVYLVEWKYEKSIRLWKNFFVSWIFIYPLTITSFC